MSSFGVRFLLEANRVLPRPALPGDTDPEAYAQWEYDTSQLVVRLWRAASDGPVRRALDLGCGLGGKTRRLVEEAGPGVRWSALDIDFKHLRQAHAHHDRHGVDVVDPLGGDAAHLPFADASFDRIVTADTLEHFPQPHQSLREMRRCLTPGGRLLLVFNPWGSPRGSHLGDLLHLPWCQLLFARTTLETAALAAAEQRAAEASDAAQAEEIRQFGRGLVHHFRHHVHPTRIGHTGMWAPVAALVQRWVAIKRRGITMGVVSTGFGLGLATMGAVFPWVVENFSWRYAWYFLGGMALALVPLNAIFLRSDPESTGLQPWGQKEAPSNPKTDTSASKTRIPLGTLFKDRRFWLIGLSYFAVAYSLYCVTTFMVDYAEYQLGLTKAIASRLASVHGLGQVVGVLTVLPLSDSLGRKKTILISNALIVVALVAILLVGKQVLLLYIFVGCVGVAYGTTFPIYGLCAGDYFPRETIATVIGAWTPFYGCGAILTHWISGTLRDSTGVYDHAFVISAIMAAVGLILMSRVKK